MNELDVIRDLFTNGLLKPGLRIVKTTAQQNADVVRIRLAREPGLAWLLTDGQCSHCKTRCEVRLNIPAVTRRDELQVTCAMCGGDVSIW